MIIVELPEEISNYKPKIIGGLTARQLVCMIVAVVMGIGIYLLGYYGFGLSSSAASYLSGFIAIPALAIGFITKDDMPFEVYLKYQIRHMLGKNKKYYKLEITERKRIDNERYFANAFWSSRKREYAKKRSVKTRKGQSEKRKIERARESIEAAKWQLRKLEKEFAKSSKEDKAASFSSTDN